MSTGFDPYHRWLSIPPADQPPTHYRILGLPPFERDQQVIENAALRQIAHVRTFLDSPMRPYAVNLIHELSVARQCLIKSESKAAYDAWLRQLSPIPALASPIADPHFLPSSVPATALQASVRRRSAPAAKESTRSPKVPTASPVSNDWIDAPPVDAGDERFWEAEQSQAAPDLGFQPRLNIKRHRKKSPIATFVALLLWVIGTGAGILAGYAILCIIDAKYDYLHLFSQPKLDALPAPISSITDDSAKKSAEQERNSRDGNHVLRRKPQSDSVVSTRDKSNDGKADHPAQKSKTSSSNPLPPGVTPKSTVFDLPENFPTYVSLPPCINVEEPVALVSFLAGTDIPSIELSLIDGSEPENGRIALVALPADPGSKSWTVNWIPASSQLTDANVEETTAIGELSIREGAVAFRWSNTANETATSALRNSVLCFSGRRTQRFVALRAPTAIEPVTIDLKSSRVHLICKCSYPPKPIDALIEITLDGFPPCTLEGHDLVGLRLDDHLTLHYTGVQDAKTQISIVRAGQYVSIEAELTYRLSSGSEQDMSSGAVARKVSQLEERLEKVKAAQEKRQVALSEQMSSIEVDLNAMKKVSDLVEKIDGNAKIEIRFYHLVGDHPVDLMESD